MSSSVDSTSSKPYVPPPAELKLAVQEIDSQQMSAASAAYGLLESLLSILKNLAKHIDELAALLPALVKHLTTQSHNPSSSPIDPSSLVLPSSSKLKKAIAQTTGIDSSQTNDKSHRDFLKEHRMSGVA
jgi:hypothetical protein